MSLRTQLILLFSALALGATVVFGVLAYNASRRALYAGALQVVESTAQERVDGLHRRLSARQGRTQAFLEAVRPRCAAETALADSAECLRMLSLFQTTEDFSASALTRPNGAPLLLGPGAETLLASPPFAPGQLARVGSHGPGQSYFVVRAAVPGDAGVVLTLRFDDLETIREIFAERAGLGRSGETFLADSRGFFLTPPRHLNPTAHSHPIDALPMRSCLSGQSGTMLAEDYRGADVIHAFQPVPWIGGGCVMAHVQQAEAFAPAVALGRWIAGVGLGLASIAVLISLLLARAVTRPILHLADSARALERGDFHHPVPTGGPKEVRTVATAFASMADAVQERTHSLEAARSAAEHARAEAEAANQAKSGFLATMSHELRTPINAVVGYTDLLDLEIAGPITDGQRAQLERIRVSSQHLLGLIEEILDLAKIESGRIEVSRERGRLGDPVETALALVTPQAARRGLTVSNQGGAGADEFYCGDEDRIRQVMVNLLSNAVKFTEPGGTVTVRCGIAAQGAEGQPAGEGPWAYISVEDTGIGIAPDQIGAVFEAFVQAESGWTRTRGGTGLGLTISRQLARLMGGDLVLRSELGTGSQFTLWLPAAPAATEQQIETGAASRG
jgi:signal transduction histidine kinase